LPSRRSNVGPFHLAQPFGVAAYFEPLPIQDEVDLLEVGTRRRVDLLASEDRSGFGPPARIADHRGEVPDDENDRVPVVLKLSQHVERDEMTDVEVRRSRVEAELDAQRLTALQTRSQVLFHVDLDRPLLQALEKCPAHPPMG